MVLDTWVNWDSLACPSLHQNFSQSMRQKAMNHQKKITNWQAQKKISEISAVNLTLQYNSILKGAVV